VKTLEINSETDLYCIFGSPVRHSLSPVIQNAAFKKAGINAVYVAFEPASIQAALQAMRHLGIKGASVTIPFKIEVLPFLDAIDPAAAAIGSVNTLVNRNGTITGHNTDGAGAMRALEKNRISVKNRTVLILGNGGSARAIATALLENQASVILAGRNRSRVEALARELEKGHGTVRSLCIDELDLKFMEIIDVIINTTPVGMAPNIDDTPLSEDLISRKHTVFDIVYSPLMTKFLTSARRKKCTIVNGIDMLISQGALQFELWTGKPAPIEAINSAILNRLRG
jgi:shikimate dehydrogenase